MSPGFVWPPQACRIGVPLRERDSAGAVTGRDGGGSLEKAGAREVEGAWGV